MVVAMKEETSALLWYEYGTPEASVGVIFCQMQMASRHIGMVFLRENRLPAYNSNLSSSSADW